MKKITVSIILDKRRKKKNETYPVKLSVFCPHPKKQKYYSTIFEFSENEFKSIWETTKPRKEHQKNRKKLFALQNKANTIIDDLKHFSFESFEKIMFDIQNADYKNVFSVFDEVTKLKIDLGAISTAEKYESAKRCIMAYLKYNGKPETLLFESINVSFLNKFTSYCENIKGLSAATIGIYLRNLRAVYNIAIKKGAISLEDYPFLKDSFSIPTSKKINKALTEAELKLLWHTTPENEQQEMAKDFWFFSYYSYGMNVRDISELTHKSVQKDNFSYVRAKTKNTKKERTIKQVPLTDTLKQIIERRKNTDSEFLFGILNKDDTPQQKHDKIKAFTNFINKNFRAFALFSGIDEQLAKQIGTYYARHSFATVSIIKGFSVALISEILHDGNLAVTENYINSFPQEAFKKLSEDMEL